jgi:DNA-binding response OmpR family regulator
MKVLVVGMSPLPWKFYQALQSKYFLHVRSVQKPFLSAIAKQKYDATIIWSEKLSPLYTKKLITHLHLEFPALKTLVLGNHLSSPQRAELLQAGAKDCMSDAVCVQELLARVHNAQDDRQSTTATVFSYGGFEFKFKEKLASFGHTLIPLNKKEIRLLSVLLQKPNQVVSSSALYAVVWNGSPPASNSLEVYMSNLRRKLEKPFGLRLFTTFKGRGYGVIVKT